MSQPERPEEAADPTPLTPASHAETTQHIPGQLDAPASADSTESWSVAEPTTQPASTTPAGVPSASPAQPTMPDVPTSPGLPPTAAYPAVPPMPAGAAPAEYPPAAYPPAAYPPVSGPGMPASAPGIPASAPGASGYPMPVGFAGQAAYPGAAVATEPKRGKAALITVSIVAVVLLLAAGGLAYGFIDRNNAYHKQVHIVSQRDSTISNDNGQINTLKSQLSSAQAQNSQLQQQATGSSNQVSELKTEKAALSKCITSINNLFDAIDAGASNSTLDKLSAKADTACSAAEKYLN